MPLSRWPEWPCCLSVRMMKYLDYSCMPDFLNRHFHRQVRRGQMMAGADKKYESGYFDIVRFFGNDRVDPKRVHLEYLDADFRLSDPTIAEFSRIVEAALGAEGRLYGRPPVMKVADYDFASARPALAVQKARYGDQAGSCFALDWEHPLFAGCGETLREYYKSRYPSDAIGDNPLALCLGICGILMVREGQTSHLLTVKRSGRLASLEGSAGPAVAGSVDWSTAYTNLGDVIDGALGGEIREELALPAGSYSITPLAFAREIFRGESPQLFCMVTTDLSRSEMTARLETLSETDREFDSYSFTELGAEGRLESATLAALGLNHEAVMNYYLIEEFLASSR